MTTKKALLTSMFLIIAVAPFSSFAETTLYGSIRTGITWADQDEGGAFDEVSDLQAIDHGSHFGLRGSEDLGNGLSAIYQLEFGVDVENNSDASTRDSFAGLRGGFGTISVGRGNTPFYQVAARTDIFNSMTGDFRSILGADVTGTNSFNQRADNIITYLTPNFNSIQFNFSYITESNPGNNLEENDDSIMSFGGDYSAGGFNIIGAYQTYSAAGNNPEPSGFRIGGNYTFDKVMVGVVYEDIDGDGTDTMDRAAFNISVKYTLSPGIHFLASLSSADDYKDVDDSGADMFAVGLTQQVNERVMLWVEYVNLANAANATYTIGGNGTEMNTRFNQIADSDQTAFTGGIRFDF